MAGLADKPARAKVDGSFDGLGTALVRIEGEIDLSSVPDLEVELEPFVQAGPDRVVFDMSAVTFMDSSGIAMLLRAANRVVFVEIQDPSSSVMLILRATGLLEVFHLEP
jgi:anti-anti-sigma factor